LSATEIKDLIKRQRETERIDVFNVNFRFFNTFKNDVASVSMEGLKSMSSDRITNFFTSSDDYGGDLNFLIDLNSLKVS